MLMMNIYNKIEYQNRLEMNLTEKKCSNKAVKKDFLENKEIDGKSKCNSSMINSMKLHLF